MYSLEVECREDERDDLLARLWELNTAGVSEIDLPGQRVRLRAFFDLQFDAAAASLEGTWREEPERDWQQESEDAWPAFAVGNRLFLSPPWNHDPAPEGRVRVTITPGIAFGTGADTTTQLVLEILERLVRPGDRVLDFGTGSGILALAADALGAGDVHGCDIDEEAVRAARSDLPSRIGLFVGSLRAVTPGWADLILANINAETLCQHAEAMRKALRETGRMIIGGVPPAHASRVCRALETQGMRLVERVDRDTWVCMSWETA